jgi:protein-S-isoprenylcysteine O-methyltransferase Ste14
MKPFLASLGKAWSPDLQKREEHKLVTSGPYARVRYPIYTALIAFPTGITLVTASWFFPALMVVSIIVLVHRIPKEEPMMFEDIGDASRT